MAWNDPGKKENPWQRRPEKGPPDLDELLRRLQKQLRGIFGGGGGAGGGAPVSPGGRAIGIGSVLLGVVALWVLFGSFYLNGAAERSVITRFGQYVKTTSGGLNMRLPWPIDRRTIINVEEVLSFSDRMRMLTQDESLFDINLAVQYRRADPVKFAFNVREPEQTLGEVSASAIREVIGQSELTAVLGAGREEIGQNTKDLIQRTIAAYNTGIEVISVNLQEVAVPEQVKPAQDDASKAKQDKDRAILAAETYANDIVPKARGLAVSVVEGARAHRSRVIADAEGQTKRFLALAAEYQRAPAVTRERLYLETIEQVLGSSAKILVDVEGTGNMIYLPIDKLMELRSPARNPTDTPPTIRLDDGSALESEDRAHGGSAEMSRGAFQVLIAVLAVVWLVSAAIFTVKETELAIKFRLREVVQADFEPGLHFMIPWIETVQKFDRRVLTRNYPAEQFLTSEGKILNVDFFVKWRISDVERYYLATSGNEEAAASRLAENVKNGLKGVIAKRTIRQVVGAERSEFIADILRSSGGSVGQLGLTLVDVRVKRIDLPDDVSEFLYQRMQQNFKREASQQRAEGDEQAQRIRAEAERERTELLANGNRDAEIIRGEGDAQAALTYARAYERHPEFFSLHRSLQAYRNSLGQQNDVLVIAPKGEFFKYFKQSGR